MRQLESVLGGIERLYGSDAFQKIRKAHVLIVGIGGVGSWAAESLVRSGIGELTLVDLDEVCQTNTNRQIHTTKTSIGRLKTEAMKERLESISEFTQVHTIEDFLGLDNLEEIITQKYDVIIDAIDSLKNKCQMAIRARELNIPLIVCGGAGGKQDPSRVKINDLSVTGQDQLLKQMRRSLRRKYNFERKGLLNISAVYSDERALYPNLNGGVCYKTELQEKSESTKLDCYSGLGAASFLTGAFGMAASYQALKLITHVD